MSGTESFQIKRLQGAKLKVNNYAVNVAGAGISNAGLQTAINSILASVIDGLGNDLQNTENGNDTTAGLACGLEMTSRLRNYVTGDVITDDPDNQDVLALVSRRTYSTGLSITGLAIDFVSQNIPADAVNTKLRFDQVANTLELSTDAGATFGTPVSLTGVATNGVIKLSNNGGTAFLSVRRTAAALPVTNTVDTLTIVSNAYALGFFVYSSGGLQPYYNSLTSLAVNFDLPVVARWEGVTPSMSLQMQEGFFDTTTAQGTKWVVESLIPTGTNTLPDLAYTPQDVTKVSLELNGVDLVYGASKDFTIAGKTITYYAGYYNINPTDKVVAKYFRQ